MNRQRSVPLDSIFPVTDRSQDEQTYFRIIDDAVRSQDPSVFSNGLPAHAIYLIYKLLDSANKRVRIYTGSLKRSLEGNLGAYADPTIIKTAIRFLQDPNSELCVVIADDLDVNEGDSPADHPFVNGIQASRAYGRFTLLRERQSEPNYREHLLIMDDQAVRVETDTENVKALVSFGDKKIASLANRLFENILERSEPIVKPA